MIHTDLKNYDISSTYIFHDIYCNSKLSRMLYCMIYTLNINYFPQLPSQWYITIPEIKNTNFNFIIRVFHDAISLI